MNKVLKNKRIVQVILMVIVLAFFTNYQNNTLKSLANVDITQYKFFTTGNYEDNDGMIDPLTNEVAILNFRMDWAYYASLKKIDTNTYLDSSSRVQVGDTIEIRLKDFENTDFEWYARGGAVDTPYAKLVDGPTSPSYCSDDQNNGSAHLRTFNVDGGNVWFTNYATVHVKRPDFSIKKVSSVGSAQLDCTDSEDGKVKTCKVNSAGEIAFNVDISRTSTDVYYSHYSDVNGCIGRFIDRFYTDSETISVKTNAYNSSEEEKLYSPIIYAPNHAFFGDSVEFRIVALDATPENINIRFGATSGLLSKGIQTDTDIFMYIPDYPTLDREYTHTTTYNSSDFGHIDNWDSVTNYVKVLIEEEEGRRSDFKEHKINLYEKPDPYIEFDDDDNTVTVGDDVKMFWGWDINKGKPESCELIIEDWEHLPITSSSPDNTTSANAFNVGDNYYSVECVRTLPNGNSSVVKTTSSLKGVVEEQTKAECNTVVNRKIVNGKDDIIDNECETGNPKEFQSSGNGWYWQCVVNDDYGVYEDNTPNVECSASCEDDEIIDINGQCVEDDTPPPPTLENPVIKELEFKANPRIINPRESCNLDWGVVAENADLITCTISSDNSNEADLTLFDIGYYNGYQTISGKTRNEGRFKNVETTTQYTLTCTDSIGDILDSKTARCSINPNFIEF